ncbi:dUTP diphosphatase [Flavobacteriaceae bacterium]|jgi:dUTP pyrophosphatase|nr:dUTP diphosphatase [Flavobacteriaceae bacterium]MDA8937596.1 dUTP diphosphatase [Flavobacteriaceae bacterium]MDA9124621.1 dUTP diphosphatase [Flavobacteriaceae bacterium]MDA9338593.1 dUTP diphosphatase [Flavobacteriaceae bacterium]MDB4113348.1 dUTP diphosphatase [Flavobacteriaceae bacterium]|tara:strand:+ start:3132 stop:3566 length:435 start_codon:yes stop_codon:yes gene_type:complete
MVLKIVNKSNNKLPKYETELSAGMDVRAFLDSSITLEPLDRILVKTGLFAELEKGFEIQVRPRSGLALKKGITVLNSPGTIDADYRGEIGVILINLSKEKFVISSGDRIAQLVVCKHEQPKIVLSNSLSETQRGDKGFGSTGIN